MKETTKSAAKKNIISPPTNFTHLTHVDRSDTVDNLVHALQTRVVPIDAGLPDTVPLPRKASASPAGTLGRGTLPRGSGMPTLFSSSTSNLQTMSSGYGTWNAGAKGKIKRANLMATEFLVPKSRAPEVPSPSTPSASNFLAAPRHARSVSASNEDYSLYTRGYVNVKTFGQPHPHADAHSAYKHAENAEYLQPYHVLAKSGHLPTHPSSTPLAPPKERASTVHTTTQPDVVFRPPREIAPPPPRDSHHETNADTPVRAPDRITITLARPTDLFGPGPGGPGGLFGGGQAHIDIDDVVPIPCPGSLDSGVSEPPFPAPTTTKPESISPEEVKEYLERIRTFYTELKDTEQLDTNGVLVREKLLGPAADMLIADMDAATRKKRPAPAPPVGGAGGGPAAPAAAGEAAARTPTPPVPKPRTTKPGVSSAAGSPVDGASSLTPTPSSSGFGTGSGSGSGTSGTDSPLSLEARFNALPEAAASVHLDPSTLKLAPERSQLARAVLSDSDEDDDEIVTRL